MSPRKGRHEIMVFAVEQPPRIRKRACRMKELPRSFGTLA
jgi:hypothetical protein